MKCRPPPLVSAAWLADRINTVRVCDASWYLPSANRTPRAEHADARIPTAAFFDVDKQTDDTSGLPHMLPSAEYFEQSMRRLNIGADDHVVAYDTAGIFSAPRLWWMLRAFGHDKVSVLDGGLKAWQTAGGALERGAPSPPEAAAAPFVARLDPELVLNLESVRANLDAPADSSILMVDARSAGRFSGRDPEPRAGLRSGHIPRSVNVPFGTLLDKESGTMLDEASLRAAFEEAGVAVDSVRSLGVTCGSGMTAAILALGLARLGRWDVRLYDGSFSQWGDPAFGAPVESDA